MNISAYALRAMAPILFRKLICPVASRKPSERGEYTYHTNMKLGLQKENRDDNTRGL